MGQGRRATGVCSEYVPGEVRLPAHPLSPPWLIGSESSTQQRSEEQKLPPGGPQADRQAQGPESLLDLRKVRTKLGRRPGWEAGTRWAEDPRGTWPAGWAPGRNRGDRGSLEKPQGSPKKGQGRPTRPKGGQRTREETRKRRDQEEGVLVQ